MTLGKIFSNMNLSPWYAIGEFVDNSITSALKNLDQLKHLNGEAYVLEIDIDFLEDGALRVTHNAAGITRAAFQRALNIGGPPTNAGVGLSVHGIGMKMAAFWWGKDLTIQTWPISEEHGWRCHLNVDYVSGNSTPIQMGVQAIPDRSPGTVVTISNLNQRKLGMSTGELIQTHLASIYRLYLDDSGELKVVIRYAGKPLEHRRPLLLTAPFWDSARGAADGAQPIEWRKDIKIPLSDDKVITGWVGIMETMKVRQSGLFLHFRGKGILGAVAPYKPPLIFGSPGSARDKSLIGELDVSALGKAITADAVPWDISTEQAFITDLNRCLQEAPMDILAMVDNYRRR